MIELLCDNSTCCKVAGDNNDYHRSRQRQTFNMSVKSMRISLDHFIFVLPCTNVKTWSCQNLCDALTFLLDSIFIRFGTKLYRQVDGISMGTNCAPLVADLFLFCYERDFMMPLFDDKQADIIEAFNTTSRY